MDKNMNWSPADNVLNHRLSNLSRHHLNNNLVHEDDACSSLEKWLSLWQESILSVDRYSSSSSAVKINLQYQLGLFNGNFVVNLDDGLNDKTCVDSSSSSLGSTDSSDSDGLSASESEEEPCVNANVPGESVRDAACDVSRQGEAEDIYESKHSPPEHGQISTSSQTRGDIMGFKNAFKESLQLGSMLEHVSLNPTTGDHTGKGTGVIEKTGLDPTETRTIHRFSICSSDEDDEEDVELRQRRLQRSTSLKTGKTPPGTPGRKKIVRFADALGLDLARVRTFLDGIPNIPKSAYKDLNAGDLLEDNNHIISQVSSAPRFNRTLTANFTTISNPPNFIEKLKFQKVCLEHAYVVENMIVRGIIRCLNIDFHKSVALRVTTDDWKTFKDLNATYVMNSCDGLSDRFSFNLYQDCLEPGQRVAFAICYRVAGQEFWDSNNGDNYVFSCVTSTNVPQS